MKLKWLITSALAISISFSALANSVIDFDLSTSYTKEEIVRDGLLSLGTKVRGVKITKTLKNPFHLLGGLSVDSRQLELKLEQLRLDRGSISMAIIFIENSSFESIEFDLENKTHACNILSTVAQTSEGQSIFIFKLLKCNVSGQRVSIPQNIEQGIFTIDEENYEIKAIQEES